MIAPAELALLPHASKVLFESDVVQIGATRCPAWHADFETPGPIQRHAFYLGGAPVEVLHPERQPFVADATTVSFHHRGDEVQRRAAAGGGDYGNWFAISPDYLLSTLERIDPEIGARGDRPFRHAQGPCAPSAFALQRVLVEELSSTTPPDALTTEEAALHLLAQVTHAAARVRCAVDADPRVDTLGRHASLVDSVRQLLATEFRSPMALPELARRVQSSPYHLARTFRRLTGWSLHGYRNQVRLRAAFDSVLAGEEDLAQLALHLGFSSHSHLSTAFRRVFGVAPSELRRISRRTLDALRRSNQGRKS